MLQWRKTFSIGVILIGVGLSAGQGIAQVEVVLTEESRSEHQRRSDAATLTTSENMLTKLANDLSLHVRYRVAGNANAPVQALRILARDAAPDIRRHVAQNPRTPGEVLEQLANDDVPQVSQHAEWSLDCGAIDWTKPLSEEDAVRMARFAGRNTGRRMPDYAEVQVEDVGDSVVVAFSKYLHGTGYVYYKKTGRLGLSKRDTPKAGGKIRQHPDVDKLISGNTEFAFKLYGRLKHENENLCFSPYGLSAMLTMAYGGAADKTAIKMHEALCLPRAAFQVPAKSPNGADAGETYSIVWERLRILPAAQALQQRVKHIRRKGSELRIANALWGRKGYSLRSEFRLSAAGYCDDAMRRVDFADAVATRKAINGWARLWTKGKIDDILKPGVITPDTELVLANVMHFRGSWGGSFAQEQTRPGLFRPPMHASNDPEAVTRETPMMHQKGRFRFMEDASLQMLELPYAGNELAMIILLPKARHLEALEQSLAYAYFEAALGKLQSREVEVTLPRFKTTSVFSLEDTLIAMGMGRAFDRATADFEYLSHKAGVLKLHLSVVAHKATVEVDEYNAKNTPPVAVEAHPRATKSPLVSFNANQAFLFLVRHNETGAILLMGRVVDPRVPAGAGPPAGKYAAQIEKLESADIAAEVEAALAKGDRRFIGVMGVGFMVSGVPDYSKKYARADVRVLPNTSDAIDGPEHLRLQEAARRYAEQYNKLLLERRRDKEEAGK